MKKFSLYLTFIGKIYSLLFNFIYILLMISQYFKPLLKALLFCFVIYLLHFKFYYIINDTYFYYRSYTLYGVPTDRVLCLLLIIYLLIIIFFDFSLMYFNILYFISLY